MNVKIRFANQNDLERDIELDLHRNKKVISNKIDMKEVIIAEVEEEIVGCLKIEYLWTHMPFISYIIVKEEFRGLGIGLALLSFLEKYLRDEKEVEFLLSSSMTDATKAQKWHMRRGFKECGFISSINEEGVGEVFFRKDL
ncbi:GNAT family N-acetyltransferase [Clostridium sp.]|uniref:GNAT family N-acetyltransferase n=1 Tax=Clostridium sp. TaxID=1506 RepID=UPI0026117EE1|nr:GNAT family N-acetyltransferase [Clostridium sp.]